MILNKEKMFMLENKGCLSVTHNSKIDDCFMSFL